MFFQPLRVDQLEGPWYNGPSQQQKEKMLNNITNIVRSNQNAVMVRVGSSNSAVYTIFDLKAGTNSFTGSLAGAKSAWNRKYKNSRQFVAKGNHRYLTA